MAPPPNPKERFAANLRASRARSGLSQQALASRCGVERTEISAIERATREPRLGMITKLVAGLGATLNELYAGIHWSVEGERYEIDPPPRRGEK